MNDWTPCHLIDGTLVDSDEHLDVQDPALGAPFARCPSASRAQLDAAMAAARRAWAGWRRRPVAERRQSVEAIAAVLRDTVDDVAPLLTREQGKPLAASRTEILATASHIERLATIDIGPRLLRDDERGRIELHHRPLGVVAAIAPWNFPIALSVWKVAHALYTGNTVVVKPSPYTPLATLRLAVHLADRLPAGVLNVVAGGAELGAWMTQHPEVDKIAFTGSGATGRRVMAAAADRIRRITLELGGNDPAIVLADADVDAIAPRLFWGAFSNSGQICKAIKRIYVPDVLHDRLGAALAALAERVRIGPGLEEGVELGPVQNRAQHDIVRGFIDEARADGGRFLCGLRPLPPRGWFVAPTVVAGLGRGHRLVDGEPFGPVLPLVRYGDLDDALEQANDSRYGLSASVWTADPARGAAIAAELDVGTAWVNHHGGSDPFVPFGGAKESGLGCENGDEGLRQYQQLRVVQHARPESVAVPAGG